jgi:hypothetical protein
MVGERAPMFECRPILKGTCITEPGSSYFTSDEADAVAWATANATRMVEQVTIEVCAPGDVSTFGIRHISPDGGDTGWSCWFQGDKVATTSIDVLFGLGSRQFVQRSTS